MNPNDYDEDGNNIVPCPMCMSNYNPCKNGGRCPAEYSFVIEGQVRLLLDEFEATDDSSRIANVMEAVDRELEKAVEEAVEADKRRIWGEIVKLADDYSGELDTNLDNIWPIIGLPPALTPTKTDKQ